MYKILLTLLILVGFVGINQANTLYLPMVYNGEPRLTKTPTPTMIATDINEFPYNWIKIGRAGETEGDTLIFGTKPSLCHTIDAKKIDKTIYVYTDGYYGYSKESCEQALNLDLSHLSDSVFPLKECTGNNFPCVCKEFNPNDIFCGEVFKLTYPSSSYNVCNLEHECYITEK